MSAGQLDPYVEGHRESLGELLRELRFEQAALMRHVDLAIARINALDERIREARAAMHDARDAERAMR